MGKVHQLLLELGREGALKAGTERTVVEAAAAYLACEDTDIGFLYSGWAQVASVEVVEFPASAGV